MKIRTQRLISMILIVCLYLMFLPAAIIHTKALSTDMIVDAAREIIYRNEGPYGSVNRNDCSPTTLNAAGIQTIIRYITGLPAPHSVTDIRPSTPCSGKNSEGFSSQN